MKAVNTKQYAKPMTKLFFVLGFLTLNTQGLVHGSWWKSPGVAPVENPMYQEECGSCHFPYQPGLLPARSWNKLMAGLENHFEENAELAADDLAVLRTYLTEHSADDSTHKRSRKIMKSLHPDTIHLRATDTPYLKRKHRKLSSKMVTENLEVNSISNCDSCHTQASSGSFSESSINIPGYGSWDDD